MYLNISIAAPIVSETLHNIQLVHSVLSQMAQKLGQALETTESAKVVPVLEIEIKKLTEILPQLHDKTISQGVNVLIEEAHELAKKLSASPNGGIPELEAFIGKTLNALLYTSFMQSILDAPKPGNLYLRSL